MSFTFCQVVHSFVERIPLCDPKIPVQLSGQLQLLSFKGHNNLPIRDETLKRGFNQTIGPILYVFTFSPPVWRNQKRFVLSILSNTVTVLTRILIPGTWYLTYPSINLYPSPISLPLTWKWLPSSSILINFLVRSFYSVIPFSRVTDSVNKPYNY